MKRSAIVLIVLLAGCTSSDHYQITVEESGSKIVTGPFERTLLEQDPDFKLWFEFRYNEYEVDSALLLAISARAKEMQYVVVAGTWCGDSKREIPHFLKILDKVHASPDDVQFYGVDRSKKSEDGITDQFHIDRVPTIIVLKNGKEIGRIVEHPEETLEKDLEKILSSK